MAHDILIIDDEADIRDLVAGILEDEGYTTRQARNADEAIDAIVSRRPSLAILDIWLQGSSLDGLGILEHFTREHPDVPVVMISGHGNIETAVQAIRQGAYDYIEKPFKADRLLLVLERAIESGRLKQENRELRLRSGRSDVLMGASSAIHHLRQAIEKAAPTNSRVLISGPAGAGKEVAARMLHNQSRRAEGPFVAINCAALDGDELEAHLFGAAKEGERAGAFERAHGGTLLLDEVADLPLDLQSRVVRVMQENAVERVGGGRVDVDVRLVATTNQSLEMEIAEGNFREDLYYRLNVVGLKMPALRERREDVPALVHHFYAIACQAAGVSSRPLGEDALAALQAYDWPGNVRQLRNVMEWLVIMAPGEAGDLIRADMLPPEICQDTSEVLRWEKSSEIMSLPLREAREVFERDYLLAQVNRFAGNISRTAGFIGMERSALHRKLKLLGVNTDEKGK